MRSGSAILGPILAGVCAALTALSDASAAQGPAAGVPDMSGRWRLDAALSDREPAAAAPSPAAGTAAKPEKADKPAKADPSGRDAAANREAAGQPAGELVVTQTETEVVVEEKGGATRRYYPNGRTYKADDGHADIKAQWRDRLLVFEKKSQQGWRLTESWQMAPDRSRLTLEMRLEGGGRPKTNVKRVYTRVVEPNN